ncbi:MAG: hypothetical protein EPO32_05380 [Anaerolineae bacterium]|nr:MAG: hypothetical protein EPO32_05380 [Anaerolineae bacterium]
MKRVFAALLLTLALAGLLAACAPPTPEPVVITITANDIFWSQNEVTVTAGQEVTFRIHNEGVLDHDFAIDELDVHLHILPGEIGEVTVMFPEAGTLEFYCSVPGHIDAGMFGTILVTEGED